MRDSSKQPDELFQVLESLNYDNDSRNLLLNVDDNDDIEKNNYQEKTESFNQNIIRKNLLPELKKNEEQKRNLKPQLMIYIVRLILIHSIVMLVLLMLLVCSVTLNFKIFKEININVLKELSKFMKFFVTASLAEFIGMLLVIVHYIFDKSIVKLIEEFNKKNNLQENDDKEKLLNDKKTYLNFINHKNNTLELIDNYDEETNDKDNENVI